MEVCHFHQGWQKMRKLKARIILSKSNPILKQIKVINCLKALQEVLVAIDKASITLRKKCSYLKLFWSVYFVSLLIQFKCWKMRTKITPNKDYFHAVSIIWVICKRYYVEVILKEIGVIGHGNKTYCKSNKSGDESIDENREYINVWVLKLHK